MTDLPFLIKTPRLQVRCWDLEDAQGLKDAIDSSLDFLRPWMPWANNEPETLEKKRERIRNYRTAFFSKKQLTFGIFKTDTKKVIGSIAINWRVRPDVVDFGYWLRADEARQGYATEAVLGCTFAAFRALGSPLAEIYCAPANDRSAAIPARLGYLPFEPAIRKTADQRDRLSQIWRMDRARFEEIHGTVLGYALHNADGEPLW
jgi:RimJ/RimL family protein N-acetyltransferase